MCAVIALTDADGAVLAGLVAGVAVAGEAAVHVDAHAGRAARRLVLALVDVLARVGRVVGRRRAPVACERTKDREFRV